MGVGPGIQHIVIVEGPVRSGSERRNFERGNAFVYVAHPVRADIEIRNPFSRYI
ncbi:hypothetical protein D3C76_1856880 [compost metagenome]